LVNTQYLISSFGVDQDNELYLCSYGFGGGSRIYRFSGNPGTGTGEIEPDGFRLDQNYPNPFNPSTRIEFGVNRREHAELSVFDVLGRSVSVLVNAELPAGDHGVDWDASEVSGGLYFYRLKAGARSLTRKLIVLR
jgi:hypothetical protein